MLFKNIQTQQLPVKFFEGNFSFSRTCAYNNQEANKETSMIRMLSKFSLRHGKRKHYFFCGLFFTRYGPKTVIHEKRDTPIIGPSVGVLF